MNLPILSPSDFVAVFNQTLELSFPVVVIEGEVSNYKVAKNKWVYFDIKDDYTSIKCFSSVFTMRFPVENGMRISLTSRPQLHPLYNFSLQVIDAVPTGEGSIKKAADILKSKLEKEGLFSENRKRQLPYPPAKIGLITSDESAAYGDFIKVLQNRWPISTVTFINTKVQGNEASSEIVNAIHRFNQITDVDVLVIIRGGGSEDDLLAFQDEILVRAIAESRIPTLVAIGHERDFSLAELAADVRASTPSNAAEILVPEARAIISSWEDRLVALQIRGQSYIASERDGLDLNKERLARQINDYFKKEESYISNRKGVICAFDPNKVLKRGYAMIRDTQGSFINSVKVMSKDQIVNIEMNDGYVKARVLG